MNRGNAKCFLISGYPRNMRDVAEYLERVSEARLRQSVTFL